MRALSSLRESMKRGRHLLARFFARRALTDRNHAALQRLDEQLVARLATRRIPSWSQLKLLPRVLSHRERLTTFVLLLVFVSSTAVFGVRMVRSMTEPTAVVGGSYTEGVVGSPQYLNPIFASNNDADDDLLALTYAGVVRFDKNHAVVPDVASEFKLNAEGTKVTVTIPDGRRWSDGEPLTVDDVVFTFALIQDSRFKSPLNSTFKNVTVDRVDDHTVTFTRSQPLASFLSTLTVGILPEHRWQEVTPTSARLHKLNLEPVGAGPYRVREFKVDQNGDIKQYALEPNPNYHGDTPHIATLTLKFYPDAATALEALRGKAVEGLSGVDSEDRPAVEGTNAKVSSLWLPRITALYFNQKRANLKSQPLREALGLALDRHGIAQAVTGSRDSALDGPLPQGFPESAEPATPLPYDVNKAAEVLDKANLKKGDDGFRRSGTTILKLVLTTSDRPEYTRAAELVAEAWNALGIQTTINAVPASRITREVIRPRDYDVILFSQVYGNDLDPFPFWHSSQETDQGLNLANFFRRETDTALEQARTTLDAEKHAAKLAQFQDELIKVTPAIFLYQARYLYPVGKKIKGFTQDSILSPSDRFADITNWYIQSKRFFK